MESGIDERPLVMKDEGRRERESGVMVVSNILFDEDVLYARCTRYKR